MKGLGSQSLSIRLYDIYQKTSYVIWKKSDTTLGEWKNGQISFTSENEYQVEFKASMLNDNSMRSHIAVDNIEMTESACLVLKDHPKILKVWHFVKKGLAAVYNYKHCESIYKHCESNEMTVTRSDEIMADDDNRDLDDGSVIDPMDVEYKQQVQLGQEDRDFRDCMFDSDVCTWTNANGPDELDFTMGRGSTNPVTGPTSDHTSQSRKGMLGQMLHEDGSSDAEIKRRIAIARNNFAKMSNCLCNRQLNIQTRLRILKCYIWSTLLYGGETWTINDTMLKKINALEMWFYRRMQRVPWTKREEIELSGAYEAVNSSLDGINSCLDTLEEQANHLHSRMLEFLESNRANREGGYIYLDSAFPRVPGDKAQLISQQFSATDPNSPSCMKFWISVYGPGIGTISVQLLDVANNTKTPPIWKLTNEKVDNSENIWREARTTISYPRPFKVVIEAVVGETGTGDIGIDDVSFFDGPCSRQCSFQDNSCEWVIHPKIYPMWHVTLGDSSFSGHTDMDNPYSRDRLIAFKSTYNRNSPLDAATLVGPPLKKAGTDMCLALWVYMDSSYAFKLGIGSLSIVHHSGGKNTTLWSLAGSQNPRWFFAQTSFRTKSVSDKLTALSIWIPAHGQSQISPLEVTQDGRGESQVSSMDLIGSVKDHTFGIEKEAPVKIEAELLSPIFSGKETVCLTFYYAAYSSEDGADLRVISRGGVETEWWKVTRSVKDEAAGKATLKWKYGQVEIKNDQDFVSAISNGPSSPPFSFLVKCDCRHGGLVLIK
ncbi:MAM and LDL-receptor class A domain-containing protein 2 [Nymphon striatum]|nr:MAM and LDL-receptor class A domain-containing protein 2 [Nymphon striatum]